jgi:hypothetical protein
MPGPRRSLTTRFRVHRIVTPLPSRGKRLPRRVYSNPSVSRQYLSEPLRTKTGPPEAFPKPLVPLEIAYDCPPLRHFLELDLTSHRTKLSSIRDINVLLDRER